MSDAGHRKQSLSHLIFGLWLFLVKHQIHVTKIFLIFYFFLIFKALVFHSFGDETSTLIILLSTNLLIYYILEKIQVSCINHQIMTLQNQIIHICTDPLISNQKSLYFESKSRIHLQTNPKPQHTIYHIPQLFKNL